MRKFTYLLAVFAACCFQMYAAEGALNGCFTINAKGDKVIFSQGNLQYKISTDTWRFAENQWDFIGKDNENISSSTYEGWIDLFGWGTGDNPSSSCSVPSCYETFVDWGTNAISNGGNEANLWRTLSSEEWTYLVCNRPNAAKLFGMGSVNGINGLILLPDNWEGTLFTDTENGLDDRDGMYKNLDNNNYDFHTYSVAQWEVLAADGAVFFPAADFRVGVTYGSVNNSYGDYWSATPSGENGAYQFHFDATDLVPEDYDARQYGESVRLVQTVETTAVSNIIVDTKALKRIVDGQLLIEKNGKIYNATGAEIIVQ